MAKKYGLPYKGSKSKLADKILPFIPPADVFVDLFAGGCAMTHAALLSGCYERVIANDISDIPTVFINALEGKYENEDRWICREDFFRLKGSDPYVRLVWSFGNNCKNYIYGRNLEPVKKALHWAVYYGDPNPLMGLGVDVSSAMNIKNRHERWLAIRRICQKAGFSTQSGAGPDAPPPEWTSNHVRATSLSPRWGGNGYRLQSGEAQMSLAELQRGTATLNETNRSTAVLKKKSPFRIEFESLERELSTNKIATNTPPLLVLQGDYQAVQIPKGAAVYADPPYKGTDGYTKEKFDHERFYEWLRTRDFPVYISEYAMPDDFICIAEFDHRTSLARSKNKVTERLFVHEKFADNVRKQPKQ